MHGLNHITELSVAGTDAGLVSARIKTDCTDIYSLSRAIFSAFAANEAVLLEMSVKKANLEEVFLELTEASAAGSLEAAPKEENDE